MSIEIRKELAALLTDFSGQGRTLTIPRPYLELCGYDHIKALFFSQVIYWSGRSEWFYKTYDDWFEELGISEKQTRRVANELVGEGVLEVELRKQNGAPTLHYRVLQDKLYDWVAAKRGFCQTQNGYLPKVRIESDQREESIPTEGQNPIRNIESVHSITDIESETTASAPFSEESPVATVEFTLRQIGLIRGIKKISAGDRRKFRERFSELPPMTEDQVIATVEVFAAWLSRSPGVMSPGLVYLRDPLSWLPLDYSKPFKLYQGADRITENRPPPVVPVFSPLDIWNRIVTAAPCTDWSNRDPNERLTRVSRESDFISRFEELCGIAQKIHEVRGQEASWLTFRWILRNEKETNTPNWWRVLTSLRGMAEPQSRSGLNPAVEAGKRLLEKQRKAREEKENGKTGS